MTDDSGKSETGVIGGLKDSIADAFFNLRRWSPLKFVRHRMTVTPVAGVETLDDGWYGLAEKEGHFRLTTNQRKDVSAAFSAITYEIERDGPPVQSWLYRMGTDREYRTSSVRLPMRNGKHNIPAYIPEGATGLRVETAGLEGEYKFRIREVTVREIGRIHFLFLNVFAWWKENGHSAAKRKVFYMAALRRLFNPKAARVLIKNPSQLLNNNVYEEWLGAYDTLDDKDRKQISERIESFQYRPTFSIVMPTYNTPEIWLRRVIDTILDQLYPEWELCIADDCSPEPHMKAVLEEYAAKDSRVKFKIRETNGHISNASNTAIDLATGEFIVLVDHDDELPAHALYMLAEELNRHPDTDVIYSDEDKIDERGKRFDPYFKSDYNHDLFLSHNHISHLGVYRTSKIREVGGFRPEFDGSQDYDLALRVIDATTRDKIRHIPFVLYHWRAIAGSVALSGDQKEYAHTAARRAIKSHLDRNGHEEAKVVPTYTGTVHRVVYPLPEPAPMVSIIIPTRDRLDLLKRCVDSVLAKTDYANFEIFVVDNQCKDADILAYMEAMKEAGKIRVLTYDKPYNFADINNIAAAECGGSILCFLNNDIEVIDPDWLANMVGHSLRPTIGAVGAKLYFPDDTVQHGGVVLTPENTAWHAFTGCVKEDPGSSGRLILAQNYSAVTAACMVVRKDRFEQAGGFDAENFGTSYNDIDLCLKLRDLGYRTLWTPFAELYHHQSASLGMPKDESRRDQFDREAAAFKAKWQHVIDADPCYSPNLSERYCDFTLAFPPRVEKPWKQPPVPHEAAAE